MKWFKHYTDASTSQKLNIIIDKYGLEGYARYWLLVELLAEKFDGENPTFDLHLSAIKHRLRIYHGKMAERFLIDCHQSSLMSVECKGKLYTIFFPKLLEIKDNHTRNLQAKTKSLAPRREENREEKEENIYKGKISPDEIVQLWNEKMPDNGFKHCHGLGMDKHLKKFLEAINFLDTKEKWDVLFTRCLESKKLSGDNNINWKVSLLWLVDYDNALKVLNEDYKENSVIDEIDFNL